MDTPKEATQKREAERLRRKAYYLKHRSKKLASMKKRYLEHGAKIKARRTEIRKTDPARYNAYSKKSRMKHLARTLAKEQKRRDANRDQLRIYQRTWRKKNAIKCREANRKWRENHAAEIKAKSYGVSSENLVEIRKTQNDCCPGCGLSLSKLPQRRIHVDHDHATGKVRGILCNRCNAALGMVQDNPEVLKNLMGYLASH